MAINGNCKCWTGKTVRQELIAMSVAQHSLKDITDAEEAISAAVGDWRYSPESSIHYKIGQYVSEMWGPVWKDIKRQVQRELDRREQTRKFLEEMEKMDRQKARMTPEEDSEYDALTEERRAVRETLKTTPVGPRRDNLNDRLAKIRGRQDELLRRVKA